MATIASLLVELDVDAGKLNSALEGAQKNIQKFGDNIASIGGSLTKYITVPLTALGAVSVKAAGDLEALKLALKAVAGSAAGADKQFESLREVAKLPGLGLQEAVQGAVRLQAVGFSADLAKRSLLAFGNAVALTGGGRSELSQITVQLGQLAAKGKVLSQDLRPIIEAAPAVAQALKKLYGTVDSADISAKLQEQGKSSSDFIEILVNELGQLPQVAGGLKNAFENLGDSFFIASAGFGDAINKSFGLEEKINSLGDSITSLAEGFAKLSPPLQTGILVFAGLAAAAGPVLFAIGGIISIIPTIVAGATALGTAFTVALGPVGLIAAGIAAAAVLIIANWDSIVSYFTTGDGAGVFNELKEVVTGAISVITGVFELGVKQLKLEWALLKGFFGPILSEALKVSMDIAKGALGVLANTFKAFGAVLRGDWNGVWTAIKNIGAFAFNALIDLFVTSFTALGTITAKFLKSLGIGEELQKNIALINADIEKFADKFKFATSAVEKTTAAVEATVAASQKLALAAPNPNWDPAILATLKKQIEAQEELNEAAQDTATLAAGQAKLKNLNEQLEAYQKLGTQNSLEIVTDRLEKYYAVLANPDATNAAVTNATNLINALEKERDILDEVVDANKRRLMGYQQVVEPIKRGDGLQKDTATASPFAVPQGMAGLIAARTASEEFDRLIEGMRTKAPEYDSMSQGIVEASQALRDGIGGAFMGMADLIGQALTGGIDSAASFFGGLLGIIGSFMKQFGQALIQMGVAALTLQKIWMLPGVAIAAGIALVAASSVVSNLLKAGPGGGGATGFAAGGLVFGPTLGMVGEGSGTSRRNPEVIAPLDQLKSFLGGGMGGEVRFVLEGEVISGVLRNYNRGSDRRSGG